MLVQHHNSVILLLNRNILFTNNFSLLYLVSTKLIYCNIRNSYKFYQFTYIFFLLETIPRNQKLLKNQQLIALFQT